MQSPSSGSSGSHDQAQQVCTSCKARKRRCDKALPKCSLCAKKNLTCVYKSPHQNRRSAAAYGRAPRTFPAGQEPAETQSLDFSTMLFLDPGTLKHGQVESYQAGASAPAHIVELLGNMDEIHATAADFFDHIHIWMPFISKKRYYDLCLRPSSHSRQDIALLLLAVKLITTFPPTNPRNPRTSLYYTTKHFHLEVEGSSSPSIIILQAGLLLALYELGHAIYPAAFLSIGACARYAYALGINVSKTLKIKRVLTLVEAEERRRVWWAIVILDRFVSIGCPGRPFATPDPTLDDYLPADDEAWDRGIVRPGDSFKLSSPTNKHMSKFTLLCQAARLLSQVLRNVSSDSDMEDDVWIQLDRTLQSMLSASLTTERPDLDQRSFVYSTLVALYTPWLYSKDPDAPASPRAQRAKAIIQQIINEIRTNVMEKRCFLGRNPEDLSPWGLCFAYHVCLAHMRYEIRTPEVDELAETLKQTMQQIDVRWNAAGAYLQLLEAQEVMHNF